MPIMLKKKDIKIPDNKFQQFVNNDSGYAWSFTADRKEKYKNSLDIRLKSKKNIKM